MQSLLIAVLVAQGAPPPLIRVPVAPPSPPPLRAYRAPDPDVATPARLLNPAEVVRAKDYPRAALRAGAQGRVRVEAIVSAKGRATACRVMAGSGSAELDAATCAAITARARFAPARRVRDGKAVAGTAPVILRWVLP